MHIVNVFEITAKNDKQTFVEIAREKEKCSINGPLPSKSRLKNSSGT